MNILICDPQKVKSLGTASTHVHGVVSSLSQMGHNVVLLNSDRPKSEAEIDANPHSSLWRRVKNSLLNWRILRLVGGDIAILWLFLRAIYVFLLAFIVIVRQNRRLDVIYRRHTLFNSEYLLAKIFRIPLVKEVNGLVADEIRMMGWGNKISLRIMDRIEQFNMPKADKIIVVTPRLKETLRKDYRVLSDKIVVIPNGANTDLFRPVDTKIARENLKLNQSNSYICFIGAFHAWAGIENIVKSAPLVLQECPDTLFLLVGDGALKQELINLAEQVGISDKIIFTGMVPYQEVPLYINASDVCVCPGAENFRNNRVGGGSPLKLPEYMACGRPVVIGSVVELSKDVVDSGSGLAVDMRNTDELARVFISLLRDEELRKKMGEMGRKAAAEKYSWMRVAEQVAKVCQNVVKQKEVRIKFSHG